MCELRFVYNVIPGMTVFNLPRLPRIADLELDYFLFMVKLGNELIYVSL